MDTDVFTTFSLQDLLDHQLRATCEALAINKAISVRLGDNVRSEDLLQSSPRQSSRCSPPPGTPRKAGSLTVLPQGTPRGVLEGTPRRQSTRPELPQGTPRYAESMATHAAMGNWLLRRHLRPESSNEVGGNAYVKGAAKSEANFNAKDRSHQIVEVERGSDPDL